MPIWSSNYRAERDRGFTLIEILVTISIILILLSVSYVSFGTSRERANDGSTKEQLGLMRIEAERIYRVDRNFNNICSGVSSAGLVSELPTGTPFTCLDTGGYAFEAELSDGTYYCVDAFGRARENTGSAISGTDCAGGDCDCRL